MHPSTFEYLKPTDEQVEQMNRVRAAAKAYNDILERELQARIRLLLFATIGPTQCGLMLQLPDCQMGHHGNNLTQIQT